jgi:HK97 family phage prohead protease
MTDLVEQRTTRGVVEMRASEEGQRIGGYAAKFDKMSQNLGGFVEQIAPGFFDSSRDSGWDGVMARYNHETLLATTAAGSLRLLIDKIGLDYELDLLPDPISQRVHMLTQRGDVRQSSFAFYTAEDDWGLTEHGFPLRTLLKGKLVDVAPVDSPAYLDTSTGLRSFAEHRGLDITEVQELAKANNLADLLKAPSVVIDLGSSTPAERGETCGSAVRLELLRRELEMKKAV